MCCCEMTGSDLLFSPYICDGPGHLQQFMVPPYAYSLIFIYPFQEFFRFLCKDTVFFNIGLSSDFGAFVRAVMEGVAFSQKDCLDIVVSQSSKPDIIPLGGGAANSPLWCQIFADILNVPVSSLLSNETETLGDIIIAAQAAGIKEVPADLGKTMAKAGRIFRPVPEHIEIYNRQFQKYKDLYQTLKPLF